MNEPDYQSIYSDFCQLDTTQQSLLKRAVLPEDLIEIPAFYELYRKHYKEPGQRQGLLRLIYCLPFIRHQPEGKSLGTALSGIGSDGRAKVSEKRIIQISRIEDSSTAMSQLRRLLKHMKPELDWVKAAKCIWYWSKNSRRKLLEDYFLAQPPKSK